jgi:hypothetical protein
VKGSKTINQTNRSWKEAGTAILISDKTGFKPKLVIRDKEGHYILIKGTAHQEDVMSMLNVNVPNSWNNHYLK